MSSTICFLSRESWVLTEVWCGHRRHPAFAGLTFGGPGCRIEGGGGDGSIRWLLRGGMHPNPCSFWSCRPLAKSLDRPAGHRNAGNRNKIAYSCNLAAHSVALPRELGRLVLTDDIPKEVVDIRQCTRVMVTRETMSEMGRLPDPMVAAFERPRLSEGCARP